MKTQSNQIVMLEWLLPLLDQQLTQVSDGWQHSSDFDASFMALSYRQIASTLLMTNLPRLSQLSHSLSQLAAADKQGLVPAQRRRLGHFAHQLLKDELIYYVQEGDYRRTLIDSSIANIRQVLSSVGASSSDNTIYSEADFNEQNAQTDDTNTLIKRVDRIIPEHTATSALQQEQYQQLLLVWRQQTQQLLIANKNQSAMLQALIKVSHYLWQTKALLKSDSQRLWYLTELWLSNLTHNQQPLPTHYNQLLARLEQLLEPYAKPVQTQPSQTKLPEILATEQNELIEPLLTDIYVQLSCLTTIDNATQAKLATLSSKADISLHFLPRVLAELESIVFGLDHPETLIAPLQRLKTQFERRGWSIYETKVEQILTDLKASMSPEALFAQNQWQIESQLQELYSSIYNTEQSIYTNIGTVVSFRPNVSFDAIEDTITSETQKTSGLAALHEDYLKQLRLVFSSIKLNFVDYIEDKPDTVLATADNFAEINTILADMELFSLQKISDQLDELFSQIAEHKIKTISWELTQALVAIIATLERLLDYLAQQVLDKYLVQQAYDHIESAQALLAARLASADTDEMVAASNYLKSKPAANVLRYDDSGEIAAPSDVQSADANNTEDVASNNLVASNAAMADDNDEKRILALATGRSDDMAIDDAERSRFVEQAMEVIMDLQDFFPIWEEEPEDLTALVEVKRNFSGLQTLAQLVNATDISTLTRTLEKLLEQVLEGSLAANDELVALVRQSLEQVPILIADFVDLQVSSINVADVLLQRDNLLAGLPVDSNAAVVSVKSADNDSSIDISNDVDTDTTVNETIEGADTALFETEDDSSTTLESVVPNKDSSQISAEAAQIPAELLAFVEQVAPLPTDGNDVDLDIKEIFIEEAEEVLTEITPLYDQWRENTSDLTVLIEVRRGFHTLKGSGRMVGANYSAELAWSIENLINHILDRTITVSTDMELLIKDVLDVYPKLMATFTKDRHDYPAQVLLWVACANAYSQQQAEDFSYANWRKALISTQVDSDHSADKEHTEGSANTTLQTIYSVNEIMAEAALVVAPQSLEEQAFYKIFSEEAYSLLQEITGFVETHQGQDHVEVGDQIVRAFHTLRAASGSSALVAISEVSATIEHSLEQLQQSDTPMTPQHLQALAQSVTLIEGYLSSYDQNVQQQNITRQDPQSQQDLVSLQAILDESEETPAATDSLLKVEQLLELGIDDLLDAEWQLASAFDTTSAPDIISVSGTLVTDEDRQRFESYSRQMRQQIAKLLTKTEESPKFCALLQALDTAYEYLISAPMMATDADIQHILLQGHAQLIGLFDALAGSMSLKVDLQVIEDLYAISHRAEPIIKDAPEIIYSVQSIPAHKLHSEIVDTDSELLEIFVQEAQELHDAIAQSFEQWRDDIHNQEALKKLQRYLHTLKGGAQMAGIVSMSQLAYECANIYERFVKDSIKPTAQWVDVMGRVQALLALQTSYILTHQQSFFVTELIEQWRKIEQTGELPAQVTLIIPTLKDKSGAHQPLAIIERSRQDTNTANQAGSMEQLIAESWPNGQPDADILQVYLEEADELIGSSNDHLQQFLEDNNDTQALQSLQRDLHTIKGGARMVAANGIADLAHEMETVYEELATHRYAASKLVSKLLIACHDWIVDAVFILRQQVNPLTPASLIASLKQLSTNPDSLQLIPNETLDAQRNAILTAKTKHQPQQLVKSISQMPLMSGSFTEQVESVSSTEMIRISGSLVEHMINLSGESAINRARIDMGMSSLSNSIEEMGTTVQRLADQLRRMEVELEVQILAQIDEELIEDEDFDPLEMDQYSSLNQLSKSLSESASDLIDINSTLLEKTRDSENLLLQLSRTQTELQDGLMKSRIVPFTRLNSRLERIVRQTANELNKSVHLEIINADDEMDRNILERITSPLEHMLRNAVDHGIEDTQTRLQAGKDRSGTITLEVLREGSEVVIRLSDDGRGIDVEAVRKKAIAKKLIDSDDDTLSDLDVMQYIFNAGLTTTEQLSQISGRGVGMDVVISEVRQLGGIVSVASSPGQGSQFTMRVPLSVAITDALVVRVADNYYAIPLVQIERVVRVNPEKFYDYYQSGAATLDIEDEPYRIRYLNEILSGNKFNELMVNNNTSLPLIIIKNRTGQKLALQVDQIAGSRIEVVVKPLGRQLSHIAGISAATIMGDGSVMFILDLIALMRNAPAQKVITPALVIDEPSTQVQPTVLVVDDSVTVRKVTSRFLERQGIKVLIAKDGVDAVEILQESIPDLILLDIEMPRMDGFEVATQIRYSKRLQHIPIIMITSRTGEKHRERAFEIGVNDYVGKPFQEKQLLKKIQLLLGKKVSLDYEA